MILLSSLTRLIKIILLGYLPLAISTCFCLTSASSSFCLTISEVAFDSWRDLMRSTSSRMSPFESLSMSKMRASLRFRFERSEAIETISSFYMNN